LTAAIVTSGDRRTRSNPPYTRRTPVGSPSAAGKQVREVGSGAECGAGTGEDHGGDVVTGLQFVERGRQVRDELAERMLRRAHPLPDRLLDPSVGQRISARVSGGTRTVR
jgi:hypothetical protein